jgi:ParB-like chromosome segregation protein Spo0J
MTERNRSIHFLSGLASRDFGGLTAGDAISKLDPERVQHLAAQIKESGRIDPLLIDTRNRELRDGHHRLAAAQFLGIKSLPTTNRL